MSAARPTWSSAVGSAMAPTFQYSSRDLKYHDKLKLRRPEDTVLRVDFGSGAAREALPATVDDDVDFMLPPSRDGDGDEAAERIDEPIQETDAEASDVEASRGSGTSQGEASEEEDDTEALLRELEKIKKEREAEREKKALEELSKAVQGNPLTRGDTSGGSFLVKRRWDDDTIFKSQAASTTDPKKKSFINDTLRSDFHRKFMKRYIK